jgi:hypothetical protein
MTGTQRRPSRAPSTASNKDMANNAALLGALMAFGGASKSNGDIVRSRGNSPNTPASSLRGRPSGLSPSPSYRQSATAPSTTRVSPAVLTRTNAIAVRNDNNDTTRAKTERPIPPPLKPKPRRLSEHQYKPQPISPATSFIGILENSKLRLPTLKQHPNVLPPQDPSVSMEVRNQAEVPPIQSESLQPRQKDSAQPVEKIEILASGRGAASGHPSADHRAQDRTRAQVQARLAEAQNRARSQDISSGDDSSEEYVSASEDTAQSPMSVPRQRTAAITKQPPQPPPTRSRPPPSYRNSLHDSSQPIDVAAAPRPSISSVRSMSSQSNPSLNATYHQLYPRRTTQLTLGEDLANAIVASSLATSRASSPNKLAPPSVTSRRHDHHSHHSPFHSRTASPTKSTKSAKKVQGMRHTLREPDSSSSESETEQHPYGKHKKKRHLRPKHPNKHHEGMSSRLDQSYESTR